jgi:1-deoxy-D-xylulose-5-phosphate reductoisomerase
MDKKKNIAILGSTGSIGTQALDVIRSQRDRFEVRLLTAHRNADLLIEQAIEFQADSVVIVDETSYKKVKEALSSYPIKVYAGINSVIQLMASDAIDMVLTAMVGYAGLLPTVEAIKHGKQIALANKETLVVAGEIVQSLALKHRAPIIPVDSEHSAIFQCLVGEGNNPIEKIILTASGGPFRGKKKDEIYHARPEQALKHPNWVMGAKITIDSASLMNKGLEVIEAKWLFDLRLDQIDVIVHPQSIAHSFVQFEDGSMKAQLGLPDMKLPIQYAFGFPHRIKNEFPRFSFFDHPTLTFEAPDIETFPCLGLAFEALKQGGNMACILNAANEIAVERFLNKEIVFGQIPELVEKCMKRVDHIHRPLLEDLIQTDEQTRIFARALKFL